LVVGRRSSVVGRREAPASAREAADLLRRSSEEKLTVRIVGGGTKPWGRALDADLELSTAALGDIREHNEGDLTAILEPGVPLARAQERVAGSGQMLALDPPTGEEERATIGGVIASGDSGPLRHSYGAARDLVVGVTIALSDGTIARGGGRVIKNVAGYDLPKLFAGSFGTLGLIVEAVVRLHPRPELTATALGTSREPALVAEAASTLAHERIELQSLDVRWSGGEGAVLARVGGAAPHPHAEEAGSVLRDRGLSVELIDEDDELWEEQRAGQRSASGTLVRVSGLQTGLLDLLSATERLGGSLVGRAALGLSWITLPDRGAGEAALAVEELRRQLAGAGCVLLDAPAEVRAQLDPWGPLDAPGLALMRRVKERFDPAGTCNPGLFVGGI
jgi:glycolate oxidase FAD binding subunit